jgi:hypothetical protein
MAHKQVLSTRDSLDRDMTPHTIEVRSSPYLNDFGEQQWVGNPRSYDCLIQAHSDRQVGPNGEEYVLDWKVHVFTTDTFTVDDEVTLNGEVRKPVRVDSMSDHREAHHSVLFFGRPAGGTAF